MRIGAQSKEWWGSLSGDGEITRGAAFTMPTATSANGMAESVMCRPASARRRNIRWVVFDDEPRVLRVGVQRAAVTFRSVVALSRRGR